MLDNRQNMGDLIELIDQAIEKADKLEQHSVAATLAHAHEIIQSQMTPNK